MPVEWYRNAYAYVVTEEEEEDKWYIPMNPARVSQRDPRQVKAIARQHAITLGLPYDPPSYSEAAERQPESMYMPPPIMPELQWVTQPLVSSKPTHVDGPYAPRISSTGRQAGIHRYTGIAHAGVATAPDIMQRRGHHALAHAGVATAPQQEGHHALAHTGVATAPDMMQQGGHHALAHAGVATAPDMMQQGGHHALAHAGVAMAPDMMQPGG